MQTSPRAGWLILAALFCSVSLTSARAQMGARAIPLDPDSALVVTLERLGGEPLRLNAAVQQALDHATVVREAQAQLQAAEGALLLEKGAFDPEIFAEVARDGSEMPSSSPFARPDVIEEESTRATAGARVQLPLGTEIELAVDANRVDTNSEFTVIDPEYRADGRLTVRQPLLRGFGPGTSAPRTAAERQYEASRDVYRDAVLATRAQVETVYWQLYAAERDFAVQQLIVERAEALLAQARSRAEAGLAGPNEVANARVFLAEQNIAVLDLEERLDAISDEMATLTGMSPREGTRRFRSSDNPQERSEVPALDGLLERALTENASLRAAERAVVAAEARERGARWRLLPQLDLLGEIGGTGLSGRSREVIFGGDTLRVDVDGGYGSALDDVASGEFPAWSVGIELRWPIGLREERGAHRVAAAAIETARQRAEAIRRDVIERVRGAHRELAHGMQRLEWAREGVDASLEQVRIGLIEYENGRTTAFEIVRLGADLAAAQQRLSDALVRAARASAELRYLTGEGLPLLDER